jgi:hypothetical protein
MSRIKEEYNSYSAGTASREEVERKLERIHLMTLERLLAGETEYYDAEEDGPARREGMFCFTEVEFYPYAHDGERGGSGIRGTRQEVPSVLVAIFPELAESAFVAEVGQRDWTGGCFKPDVFGERWLVRYHGGKRITRWTLPPVTDMSTEQIVAVLALEGQLDKREGWRTPEYLRLTGVDFGRMWPWFREAALKELARRSLMSFPHDRASVWMAEKFDVEPVGFWTGVWPQIDWLQGINERPGGRCTGSDRSRTLP